MSQGPPLTLGKFEGEDLVAEARPSPALRWGLLVASLVLGLGTYASFPVTQALTFVPLVTATGLTAIFCVVANRARFRVWLEGNGVLRVEDIIGIDPSRRYEGRLEEIDYVEWRREPRGVMLILQWKEPSDPLHILLTADLDIARAQSFFASHGMRVLEEGK